MKHALFNKVVIIGVGLIGGSMGIRMHREKLAREIVGIGRDPKNLREAVRRKAITSGASPREFRRVVHGADLIILATPVRSINDWLRRIGVAARRGQLAKGVIVTDVGSSKQTVMAAARRWLPASVVFVGGHPVAGTEKSRAAAADSKLFEKRVVVLTPTARTPASQTSKSALQRVTRLWRALGARVVLLTSRRHDRFLAHTSHLPHMVAYSLIHTVATLPQALAFVGGSFKDFTRITQSEPTMWRDIVLENRHEITAALSRYQKHLQALQRHIRRGEAGALQRFFQTGKHLREKLS